MGKAEHAGGTSLTDGLATRSSLLSRLRRWDDAESWREFFGRYRRFIRELALKWGLTEPEADEVVQETMLIVAREMPEFQYSPTAGSFKNWLYSVTQNCVNRQFDARRKARRRAADAANGASEHASMEAFEMQWEEEWRSALFSLAMERVRRRVKPKQFQMFDLYVTQQRPMLQVKRLLNVNAAQVYMAKMRIGSLIRKEIAGLRARLI